MQPVLYKNSIYSFYNLRLIYFFLNRKKVKWDNEQLSLILVLYATWGILGTPLSRNADMSN